MNTKKSIVPSIFLAILFVFLFVLCVKSVKANIPENVVWEEYTVVYGDTLWDICNISEKYDIRDIIMMVQEHNNISSTIYAGQTIEIPVIIDD